MPVSDYDKMCSLDNLRRAYRWLQSNPDALYKSFFRDAYSAYAAASEYNLNRLRKHLLRHAFEASHASKVYFPKPSGILRPYTLLTVDDQIVYQATVNIIADKLHPLIKKRYFKNTFGHLYAGKSSSFFYVKWQRGYHSYSNAILDAINKGFKWVANFDLASFYDTIDHTVLKHFLSDIQIEHDLVDFFLACLKIWTSNTWTNISNVIYHGHGIPQGPLSSGLLSEVILKHMDERGTRREWRKETKYLRYVDDIKIFAKKEKLLKQRLVALDLTAKEIGLFPQSSKVNVRQVSNPYEEIKSVSRTATTSSPPAKNQEKLRDQVRAICKGGAVKSENLTRFKYLVSRAEPHYKLNEPLIKVMQKQPALSVNICAYFARYAQLPKKSAEQLFHYIANEEIYHSAQANVLMAVLDKLSEPYRSLCLGYCSGRLAGGRKGYVPPQPTLKAALIAWVLKENRLLYSEMHKLILEEIDWWVVKDVLKYVQRDQYGPASYEAFLNDLIKGRSADVVCIAALLIINEGLEFRGSLKDVHESARLLLFAAGKIRKIGKVDSLVGKVLCSVLDNPFPPFDWAKIFETKHKAAEHIAFTIKTDYESNINACIVTLDSLCDLLFERLFNKYLPARTYGDYGAMLKNPTMQTTFPKTCTGFATLHNLRLESVTAHPRQKKTGKPTRRLKHYDLYNIRPFLSDAFNEIILTVT